MNKLKVKQGKLEEINKDIIRVHESKRKTESGEDIKSGIVCRIFVKETHKNIYAILRGHSVSDQDKGDIFIDEALRENLDIEEGQDYLFEFKEASRLWGWWRWAWNASDPSYQISIRVAVVLGTLSVILGLVAILQATLF